MPSERNIDNSRRSERTCADTFYGRNGRFGAEICAVLLRFQASNLGAPVWLIYSGAQQFRQPPREGWIGFISYHLRTVLN